MIFLSPLQFDPFGPLSVEPLPDSDITTIERRVSRAATLDGGASFTDTGQWAADRTFTLRWRLASEAELRQAQRMVRLFPRLRFTSTEGVFIVSPQRITQRDGTAQMTLLVAEQENDPA